VVCIPTDTVYGLAASVSSNDAINEIFLIKNRSEKNPIPVLINSASQLSLYVDDFPEVARALAHEFWPGSLTIVLKKSARLPDALSGGLDTTGFRVPAHDVPKQLCSTTESAITGTSANKSGFPPARSAKDAFDQLKDTSIELIIDGGTTDSGAPSTIIDCSGIAPKLIRSGAIPKERIWKLIEDMGETWDHE